MCLSKKELLNLIEKKYSPAFLLSSGESALHNMLYAYLSNPFAELIVYLGKGVEALALGLSRFKVEACFQCDDMSIRKQGEGLSRVFVILNLILNLVQDDILTMEGSLCFP